MATGTIHLGHFQNLPPELLEMVFKHSDATALAQNRSVCAYWCNTIESICTTRLDMTNSNWEAYVKMSTASKIHLKLKNIQYPIYIVPEFDDFMSRVNSMEVTGFIPEYNVINIFNGCRKVKSVYIHHVQCDSTASLLKFNNEKKDLTFELTELTVGKSKHRETKLRDLLLVANHVSALLKFNCLKELNLSKIFKVENVLRLIFVEILEGQPPNDYEDKVVKRILDEQRKSLQIIRFYYKHDKAPPPRHLEFFIKFHPLPENAASSSSITTSTNHGFQILQARLYRVEDYLEGGEFTGLLLRIFETQFRMKNLQICYRNQTDLDQIVKIVKNNSGTLEQIVIGSMENMEGTFRSFSCACFAECLFLKKLFLCSENPISRKIKLLDLLHLPTCLEKLLLIGFIPTGSSELFGRVTESSQYPKLTVMLLGHLPWFIQDGNPITVFENTQIRWLLNMFPKIRKLTLLGPRIDRFITVETANVMGMENIPDSISPEFVTWCRQGGGDNVKIDSIQIFGEHEDDPLPEFNPLMETGCKITIGNSQH